MNKTRRKELERAIELLGEDKDIVDSCRDEEQEYLDNMPENLQGSERYERAEEAVNYLDEAYDKIDEVIDNIESASE